MIETIRFKEKNYPKFQAEGFAAQFIFPFAEQVCGGYGYDIGCNCLEWKFPNAFPIDTTFNNWFEGKLVNAFWFPDHDLVDYIFSSHCLEHLNNWVDALDYWTSKIRSGGTLFLYLPHPDQEYWLPFNNRKHLNYLTPDLIEKYLISSGKYKNIFVSGRDLNHSFAAMAEKI